MKSTFEKQQIRNNQALISTNNLTAQSLGANGHVYLANGGSNTSDTFTSFQVVGNPSTPDTVTVSYTVTNEAGVDIAFTSQELYVGDIVLGVIMKNISVTAGDGRIRAYIA